MNAILRPFLAALMLLSLCVDALLKMPTQIKRALVSPAQRHKKAKEQQGLDPEKALELLDRIMAVSARSGAGVFLVSGTLLGLYRNGRILGHDYDIDLGVMADDPGLPQLLRDLGAISDVRAVKEYGLRSSELRLNPWLVNSNGIEIYKFAFDNPTLPGATFNVDLFIHWRSNGYIVHGSHRTLWLNADFGLAPLKVGKHSYLAPDNIELYLTENYGEFRKENRDYHNSTDCPNIANIYGFRAAMRLSTLYFRFMAQGRHAKRRIIGRRIADMLAYGLFVKGTPTWRIGQYTDGPT